MNVQRFDVIDPLLKPYIGFYYLLSTEGETGAAVYTAYPSNSTPVCFFMDAEITIAPGSAVVTRSANKKFTAIIVGNRKAPIHISIGDGVKEFCISFKPLGINHLHASRLGPMLKNELAATDLFNDLEMIISKMIRTESVADISLLEEKLVTKIKAQEELKRIIVMIALFEKEKLNIKQMAATVFTTEKNIYRLFKDHLGLSPMQFLRINKFRRALTQATQLTDKHSLSDISLDSGYYDQADLSNEVKKMSHASPRALFASVTPIADRKLLWKIK